MIKRSKYIGLWEELTREKPMVFLSGPRQTGKTTLAKTIANGFKNHVYFNWDISEHKKLLLADPSFFQNINRADSSAPLIVFDEIHKYRHWKNYLKGIYDQFAETYKFLISGSGRLDIYQKGGDSLAGRYFQFHLFPFTIAEISSGDRNFHEFMKNPLNVDGSGPQNHGQDAWQTLFNVGGFPEPFIKGSKAFHTKWSANYSRQIVREDIRDLSALKRIGDMEILLSLLPSRAANLLSINNLSEEMQVAFGSVREWLNILERFYLVFRISPWTRKIARAIQKEKKLYLYDYPEIADEGARFENMAALDLLRKISNWNEHGYGKFSLHYIRNKEKEEVDFLIADNDAPKLLIETKLSDDSPAKALKHFQDILGIPAVQLVNKEGVLKYIKNGQHTILITTAHRWLSLL